LGARPVARRSESLRRRAQEWARGPGTAALLYLVTFACTLGIGILAFFAFARLIRPDANIFFIWFNSYTFWVYLPAYPVAVFAGVIRRWLLLAPALFVCAMHLWWVAPDYLDSSSVPAAARDAPGLRLVSANAMVGNATPDRFAAEVASHEPDILFVQEYHGRIGLAIERSGLRERLPYFREAYSPRWSSGLAIYSRYPLDDVDVFFVTRRPVIRIDVTIDRASLRLFNIHAISPGGRWVADPWNDGWQEYIEVFKAEERPFVVAGDFNMTQNHRWHGELQDIGLRSCHEQLGRGSASTWPYGSGRRLYRLLPKIRIDHVFVSEGVACMAISEGHASGSDHRPVIATLAVLP
jgi:endonuclease/exonuclease/phosphatase (EEP) superfamily protein YafD